MWLQKSTRTKANEDEKVCEGACVFVYICVYFDVDYDYEVRIKAFVSK